MYSSTERDIIIRVVTVNQTSYSTCINLNKNKTKHLLLHQRHQSLHPHNQHETVTLVTASQTLPTVQSAWKSKTRHRHAHTLLLHDLMKLPHLLSQDGNPPYPLQNTGSDLSNVNRF